MAWRKKPQTHTDSSEVLRDYEEEIHAMLVAFLKEEPDVDLRLAQLVEGKPEHLRAAIVNKLRHQIQEQKAEKATKLEQLIEEQAEKAKQVSKKSMNRWVAYFISQRTRRRIKEMVMHTPALALQLTRIGKDMSREGVSYDHRIGLERDIGTFSAQVNHQQQRSQETEKGPRI